MTYKSDSRRVRVHQPRKAWQQADSVVAGAASKVLELGRDGKPSKLGPGILFTVSRTHLD